MLDTPWIIVIVLGAVLLLVLLLMLIRWLRTSPKDKTMATDPLDRADNRDCALNSKYDHDRWNSLLASIEKDTHWNPVDQPPIDNAL